MLLFFSCGTLSLAQLLSSVSSVRLSRVPSGRAAVIFRICAVRTPPPTPQLPAAGTPRLGLCHDVICSFLRWFPCTPARAAVGAISPSCHQPRLKGCSSGTVQMESVSFIAESSEGRELDFNPSCMGSKDPAPTGWGAAGSPSWGLLPSPSLSILQLGCSEFGSVRAETLPPG